MHSVDELCCVLQEAMHIVPNRDIVAIWNESQRLEALAWVSAERTETDNYAKRGYMPKHVTLLLLLSETAKAER